MADYRSMLENVRESYFNREKEKVLKFAKENNLPKVEGGKDIVFTFGHSGQIRIGLRESHLGRSGSLQGAMFLSCGESWNSAQIFEDNFQYRNEEQTEKVDNFLNSAQKEIKKIEATLTANKNNELSKTKPKKQKSQTMRR